MDIPRYALIATSVLLGLMLLGEWTQFSAKQQDAALPPAPMVEPSLVQDIPAAEAGLSGSLPDSDLPVGEDVNLASAGQPEILITNASSVSQLISVETDTLEIMIDLMGGDIVGAALRQYPKILDDPSDPFVLLERNAQRTYVAQSGLVGKDGIDTGERALYRAEHAFYQLTNQQTLRVALKYSDDKSGISVTKSFHFEAGSHTITVEYEIHNSGSSAIQLTPFAQLKRDSSPAPVSTESGMGMQPFLGSATTQPDQRFSKFDFDDMADDPFRADLVGGWVAILQHYFVSAWIPEPDKTYRFRTRQTQSGFNIIGYTGPALTVSAGNTARVTNQLYVGPKNQKRLAELAPHLDLVVDYGWLWWIAQPLFWLLTFIQSVVVNWGVAIIILTFLVKLAFFQLSAAGYKSMARMRKVQPRVMAIREEYANDKGKQSQAMMELYKKEKINPLGGCLPILVQMPVFIALYWVLMESVELRQAPFALWIEDLSVMDPYFVLPLLMGASMYYMQKLNPAPPDPMQAKIMQWMPIVFTFFFLWFPAGLVLYWLCNNLLSMGQQYIINRRIESGAI
ncbi:MAG: membrane protein insertase YidC [Luminiphilus sp.]|nr:membrane protein insertase YidC [Luminiphilus sp.]